MNFQTDYRFIIQFNHLKKFRNIQARRFTKNFRDVATRSLFVHFLKVVTSNFFLQWILQLRGFKRNVENNFAYAIMRAIFGNNLGKCAKNDFERFKANEKSWVLHDKHNRRR